LLFSSPRFLARLGALTALAVTLALGAACHHAPRPRAKVVASIFPIYDLTRRVAGPDADVELLEPPELSPHAYVPTPANMQQTAGASLAVTVGLDLDPWVQAAMTRMAPTGRVLRLADRVPTMPRQPSVTDPPGRPGHNPLRRPAEEEARKQTSIDPHVWLDPQRALLMTRAICDELCRVDPDHARGYRTRSLAVTQSLDGLDREILTRTAAWKQRSFVTMHDGFRYYAGRYHLEVALAIEGDVGRAPAALTNQRLLQQLRERQPGGVFGEPQIDSDRARVLAGATKLPFGVLDPLGGTGGADSYEALIRSDTDVLEKALLPAAPPASGDAGNPTP
jgi:zinc transport system substrate-binding protein